MSSLFLEVHGEGHLHRDRNEGSNRRTPHYLTTKDRSFDTYQVYSSYVYSQLLSGLNR